MELSLLFSLLSTQEELSEALFCSTNPFLYSTLSFIFIDCRHYCFCLLPVKRNVGRVSALKHAASSLCNITSLCTVSSKTFWQTMNTATVTDDGIPSRLGWKRIKTSESYASPLDRSFRGRASVFLSVMTKLSPYCSSVLLIYIYRDHASLCVTVAFFFFFCQVYIQLMRGQRSNSALRSTKWAPGPAHSAVVAQMRKLSENVKGQVSLGGRFYRLNRSIDGVMAEGDQCAISVRMWTVFHRTDSGTSQPRRELVTFYYCGHWSYLLFLPLWPFVKRSHDFVFCFSPQMFLALVVLFFLS